MIKRSIRQEDIRIVSIHPTLEHPDTKQILDLKKETDSNTIIIRDFNTPR